MEASAICACPGIGSRLFAGPLNSKLTGFQHSLKAAPTFLVLVRKGFQSLQFSVNPKAGLVDDVYKISRNGGKKPISTTSLAGQFLELSGGIALLPHQSETVMRNVIAAVASVIYGKPREQAPAVLETPVKVRREEVQVKDDIIAADVPLRMDPVKQGRFIENMLSYRQTVVIRSYEVGADKTATIETLMNLFQEIALNHVGLSDIGGDGFGTTKAMMRNSLIWVVSRMHVEVEQYPAWGDVLEIDSWVAGSGKNGMRRDWLVRHAKTGRILAGATSTWVMMNQKTRKLSKMPDDVRAEIEPYFLDRQAVPNYVSLKINKLQESSAKYMVSELKARRTDLDMNYHVNNVKYISWMMESIPSPVLEQQELRSISLEYRRECCLTDVVLSLTSPEESQDLNGHFQNQQRPQALNLALPCLAAHESMSAIVHKSLSSPLHHQHFTHLLKLHDAGAELVRARTVWSYRQP